MKGINNNKNIFLGIVFYGTVNVINKIQIFWNEKYVNVI